MKILVPVKHVASLRDGAAPDGDGRLAADQLLWAPNEWDAFALEAALAIGESSPDSGGEVLVATVGEERAEESLRFALALGAHRAIRVWDDALAADAPTGPDALAVARVLAAIAERERPELILCGAQSSDTASAATGVALAGLLDLAHVAVVDAIECDGERLTVERELEGGASELVRLDAAGAADDPDRRESPAPCEPARDQAGADAADLVARPRRARPRCGDCRRRRRLAHGASARASALLARDADRRHARRDRREHRDARRAGADSMSGVLVCAETRSGELRPITLELIAAGQALADQGAGRLSVALIGADAAQHAEQIRSVGVEEVVLTPTPLAYFEAHVAQAALQAIIEQRSPSVVLAGHTVDSLSFAPALAAHGGYGFASDVIAASWREGALHAERGALAERLIAELDFPGKQTVVLLLRQGAFASRDAGAEGAPVADAHGAEQAAALVTNIELDLAARARSERLELRQAPAGDVDIAEGRLPARDRSRRRHGRERRQDRAASRVARRDARRLRPARRGRPGRAHAQGRPVGQDRRAARLPRARHLRRRAAPRRHVALAHDHRRQLRPAARGSSTSRTTAPSPTCSRSSTSSNAASPEHGLLRATRHSADPRGGARAVRALPRRVLARARARRLSRPSSSPR